MSQKVGKGFNRHGHTNDECPVLGRLYSTVSTSMMIYPEQYGLDKTVKCICNPPAGDIMGITSNFGDSKL